MPSAIATTGKDVARDRISGSMLSCWGARCCTTTNESPTGLMWPRSPLRASSPPADAPTPATGNPRRRAFAVAETSSDSSGVDDKEDIEKDLSGPAVARSSHLAYEECANPSSSHLRTTTD